MAFDQNYSAPANWIQTLSPCSGHARYSPRAAVPLRRESDHVPRPCVGWVLESNGSRHHDPPPPPPARPVRPGADGGPRAGAGGAGGCGGEPAAVRDRLSGRAGVAGGGVHGRAAGDAGALLLHPGCARGRGHPDRRAVGRRRGRDRASRREPGGGAGGDGGGPGGGGRAVRGGGQGV